MRQLKNKFMNNDSKEKFEIFLEVAEALNKSFQVVPILYGSLGLYRVIQRPGTVNDIDILVPDEFVNDKWENLIELAESLGFKLKDEHEHEFERDRKLVAFATELDLAKMANVKPDDLKISIVDGVKFKELSPEQYLEIYQLMLRDNYRQEKRGTADQEKIALLKENLASKTSPKTQTSHP